MHMTTARIFWSQNWGAACIPRLRQRQTIFRASYCNNSRNKWVINPYFTYHVACARPSARNFSSSPRCNSAVRTTSPPCIAGNDNTFFPHCIIQTRMHTRVKRIAGTTKRLQNERKGSPQAVHTLQVRARMLSQCHNNNNGYAEQAAAHKESKQITHFVVQQRAQHNAGL
jgi:hypothetical protein